MGFHIPAPLISPTNSHGSKRSDESSTVDEPTDINAPEHNSMNAHAMRTINIIKAGMEKMFSPLTEAELPYKLTKVAFDLAAS
ncbi:hypothetical protein EG329_000619, partial [Mollisiaceae sp. DMI_Dod_QoI]